MKSLEQVLLFASSIVDIKNNHPNYWRLKKLYRKKWEHDREKREHIRSHNEIFIMEDVTRDMTY